MGGSGESLADGDADTLKIPHHVDRQETQSAKTRAGQHGVAQGIVTRPGLGAVLGAVDLYHQAVGVGDEIQEVAAARRLAAKNDAPPGGAF